MAPALKEPPKLIKIGVKKDTFRTRQAIQRQKLGMALFKSEPPSEYQERPCGQDGA